MERSEKEEKNVERQMGENIQNGRQRKLEGEKEWGGERREKKVREGRKEKVEESKGRLDGGEWIQREKG